MPRKFKQKPLDAVVIKGSRTVDDINTLRVKPDVGKAPKTPKRGK